MQLLEALPRLISWAVPIIILAVIILPQALRILREYERGVIFRLGKLLSAKGPGLIVLIPVVDRMVKMDLRVVTIDVAKQEIMTKDNVPATVDAGVYSRGVGPPAGGSRGKIFGRPLRSSPRRPCAACWARRRSTICCRNATPSTSSCRKSLTARPSRGAS